MTDAAYRSPLLHFPGATAANPDDPTAQGLDCRGVAWHYGDPLGEQRALGAGPVWVDRSQRGVIAISGPDAAGFLNNLLSQRLDQTEDGFSAEALDLDAQGHVAHHLFVTRVGDDFYLDLPAEQAESLREYLERMVFWNQVNVQRCEVGVVTVLGNVDLDPDRLGAINAHRTDWLGPPRTDLLVPHDNLEGLAGALGDLGVRPVGLMAFHTERIKALEPEQPVDLDNKTIAHEVPHWIGRHGRRGAVHLDKGCYRGQETVARVENVGRSPRLMALVQLDGSAPSLPTPGTALKAGARTVGRMGSVTQDAHDGPIGLALIKRSALGGGQLTAGETAVLVDADSLPTDEGERAGRVAIEKLHRGR